MKRFSFHGFVPLVALLGALFLALPLSAADFARPVASETEFWTSLETSISATLLPITPDIDAFRLDLAIRQGERVCGSGTISLKRGDYALLALSSPEASFRYLAMGATATCLLDLAGKRTLFISGPERRIPIPTIRIDRAPEGDFAMNLVVNLATMIASRPIDLGVHPETPAHIIKKLRESHPWCLETPAELVFSKEPNASPTVILQRQRGLITGFEMIFPQEGSPAIRVCVTPLEIGAAAHHADVRNLFPPGRIPEPGADTLMTFMHGFYAVLSSMMPK